MNLYKVAVEIDYEFKYVENDEIVENFPGKDFGTFDCCIEAESEREIGDLIDTTVCANLIKNACRRDNITEIAILDAVIKKIDFLGERVSDKVYTYEAPLKG